MLSAENSPVPAHPPAGQCRLLHPSHSGLSSCQQWGRLWEDRVSVLQGISSLLRASGQCSRRFTTAESVQSAEKAGARHLRRRCESRAETHTTNRDKATGAAWQTSPGLGAASSCGCTVLQSESLTPASEHLSTETRSWGQMWEGQSNVFIFCCYIILKHHLFITSQLCRSEVWVELTGFSGHSITSWKSRCQQSPALP